VLRFSVAALWLLDAVHMASLIHVGYHYWIDGFGDIVSLGTIVWSLKLQTVVNFVTIVFVQSLYALRIWKLGGGHHQRLLPCLMGAVIIIGYAIGIVLTVATYKLATFSQIPSISWAIKVSFGTLTGIDFFIAGLMCYYLWKSRTSFSGVNSKISTLIQYTLSSGLGTSACSMSVLVAYWVMPDNMIFLAIEFSLTKLYINSFLAMLNARQSIRERNEDSLSVNMSNLRSGTSYPSPGGILLSGGSTKRNSSSITLPSPDAGNEKGKSMFPWTIPEEPEEV